VRPGHSGFRASFNKTKGLGFRQYQKDMPQNVRDSPNVLQDSTALIAGLNRRALDITIRTEDTAIAIEWFQ
jgi:hypothetical protein